MEDLEEGELTESAEDHAMSGSGPDIKVTNSVDVTAAIISQGRATPVPSAFAYRSTDHSRADIASSDEDQSSGQDSDDDNCHLRAPAKKMRRKGQTSQTIYAPAFTAEQSTMLQSSSLFQDNNREAIAKAATIPLSTDNAGDKKIRKRNNIWASVLGEQTLTEEIGTVGLKKLTGDRNVENYDFVAAQELIRQTEEVEEGEMLEEQEEVEEDASAHQQSCETEDAMAKRLSRKRPLSHRMYKPPPPPCPNADPGESLVLPALTADEAPTNSQLATNIANALNEQKPQIIANVVEVMGREIAMKLYVDTRQIEEGGGMVIMTGGRRRTSGGVYLQLLKQHGLTKEQQCAVFPVDDAHQMWRRRRRAVHRRRNNRADQIAVTGSNGQSDDHDQSSLASRLPLGEDSSCDAVDMTGGSKCPGSTPVTSPAASPGPTPTPTPVVTPHCSDPEDDRGNTHKRNIDTALAIVKAVSPKVAPLLEDFSGASATPQDQMDLF